MPSSRVRTGSEASSLAPLEPSAHPELHLVSDHPLAAKGCLPYLCSSMSITCGIIGERASRKPPFKPFT